jgi:hypothetical protein
VTLDAQCTDFLQKVKLYFGAMHLFKHFNCFSTHISRLCRFYNM